MTSSSFSCLPLKPGDHLIKEDHGGRVTHALFCGQASLRAGDGSSYNLQHNKFRTTTGGSTVATKEVDTKVVGSQEELEEDTFLQDCCPELEHFVVFLKQVDSSTVAVWKQTLREWCQDFQFAAASPIFMGGQHVRTTGEDHPEVVMRGSLSGDERHSISPTGEIAVADEAAAGSSSIIPQEVQDELDKEHRNSDGFVPTDLSVKEEIRHDMQNQDQLSGVNDSTESRRGNENEQPAEVNTREPPSSGSLQNKNPRPSPGKIFIPEEPGEVDQDRTAPPVVTTFPSVGLDEKAESFDPEETTNNKPNDLSTTRLVSVRFYLNRPFSRRRAVYVALRALTETPRIKLHASLVREVLESDVFPWHCLFQDEAPAFDPGVALSHMKAKRYRRQPYQEGFVSENLLESLQQGTVLMSHGAVVVRGARIARLLRFSTAAVGSWGRLGALMGAKLSERIFTQDCSVAGASLGASVASTTGTAAAASYSATASAHFGAAAYTLGAVEGGSIATSILAATS
ncbi:unnamed protein product, partial [Amoebophrya sp. A120]|eukprot:GSA120T00019957001.1